MNPNCLILLKNVVSDQVYAKLDDAVKRGDNYAWDQTMIDAHADIAFAKRQAIIDAKVTKNITDYISQQEAAHKAWIKAGKPSTGMNKGATADQALTDLISGSGARQSSGTVSLEKYIEGVRGQYTANLVDVLHETRPTMLGLMRKGDDEYARNLVRTIFGSKSAKVSKEIQAIADAWLRTTKAIMNRFNKAGGSITELADFNIPVNHLSSKIAAAGEDTWVADAKKFFDLRRSSQKSDNLDDDALLRKIYKTLADEGSTDFDPSLVGTSRGVKLGNAHQQFRYLQPKNGDAWLDYTAKYGKHQQPIDAMIEYVDGMSTSIALLENLGTNPQRSFDNVVAAMRQSSGNQGAGNQAKAALDQIMARQPGYDTWWGTTLRTLRDFQTASKLGSAPLTALTDLTFSTITSAFNGINPIRMMSRHIKLLSPTSNADRKLAGRLGLMMDYAVNRAAAINRYSDNIGYGWMHRIADFSTRASGLNHWTNSGKTAFGLEFLANMGDVAKSGKAPTGNLKRAFERYGIKDEDWGIIKSSLTTKDRTTYVDVTQLGEEHDVLKARIIGMVREETSFAIPEPNAKTRAITQANTGRNTVANEFIKTATQFKSFGVSLMITHMARLLNDTTPIASRMMYATNVFVGASAIGILSLQLKDISKGREPRELTPQLAFEGMMQGGALGIAGDIFFHDPNLFGGLPALAVGPTATDTANLMKFLWEIKDEVKAKDFAAAWYNKMAPGLAKGVNEATAFATRLWYTRLAWERGVMVHINELADPNYQKKQIRARKLLREERGQEMWYK